MKVIGLPKDIFYTLRQLGEAQEEVRRLRDELDEAMIAVAQLQARLPKDPSTYHHQSVFILPTEAVQAEAYVAEIHWGGEYEPAFNVRRVSRAVAVDVFEEGIV